MKTFKTFCSEIINEDQKKVMDPPAVLIMKRHSIRQFPNDQRVALYYVQKLNKYVTVPYTSYQWSASAPTTSPAEEL